MAGNQQFCLRWNNHQSTLISVFDNLLESGTLVDCTLAADGQYLKAHKVVLSACSPFFENLFSQHYEKHPIIILKDVTFGELKAMLDYMYRGEVNISQEQLGSFLKAAESLQIKGLTDNSGNGDHLKKNEPRKIIMPPVSKSPCFPQGLVVEQRPMKLTNNNNVDSPPILLQHQQRLLDSSSPKRRKRRISDDVTEDSGDGPVGLLVPPPLCQVTEGPPLRQYSLPSDRNTPITEQPARPGSGGGGSVSSLPPGVQPDGFKTEGKQESISNEESGDDMTGYQDDEEEEEMDLTKPGTSHATNNHPPGAWNPSTETSEDTFAPGGLQEQGMKYVNPLTLTSWDLWASMQPAFLKTALNTSGSGGYTGIDGVECTKCGRHYKLKSSLRNHQKWECGKEPQFQCPYCNYRAKQKMHVARHIERMHREKLDLLEMNERAIKEEKEVAP